jgi:hypothetical protein
VSAHGGTGVVCVPGKESTSSEGLHASGPEDVSRTRLVVWIVEVDDNNKHYYASTTE